jgi:D-xylose transport system ATP-binding protein
VSTTTSQIETNSRPKVDLNKCLVEMRNINKAFGGVHAVENVSINLYPGEVVAVLGHNGAGKSTLMKMLAGAYPIDSGDVIINGTKANIRTPADAQAAGIESIYQTLALADNLDSVANLFLGRELLTKWKTLDDHRMDADARKVFQRLNKNFKNYHTPVRRYFPGYLLQRPDSDHGRTHCGPRPRGNGDGGQAD